MRIRCPHCHNPVEVLEEELSLAEVCCPSCGSSFNLIGETETAAYDSGAIRTLGHFELVEQIGMGQFGSVWKSLDTELDRIVAVKIPRKDQLSEAEAVQFLREARAAAQLKHPNIVPVHEVGREGDTIYIVSDYVEGANLKEWLGARQPAHVESAELCAKIANAIHDAHEAGVIHRDLKPGNIMMDVAGEPHIMDFGLAKRESGEITMTVEGRVLGTPAYMSPEQAGGEAHVADCRSDVYSLGVILFELLTGELPFRGEPRMLIVQILHDEPPSPRNLDNRVSKDLETICLKCLEKEPHRRYQTARELADDLQRVVDGRPILARPIGRFERGWRWCRRHPALAAVWALLSLTLVFGSAGGLSFWQWQEAENARMGAVDARNDAEQARDEARVAQRAAESARENERRLRQEVEQARDEAEQARDGERQQRKRAEAEHLRAESLLYSSQILLAQAAWREGDVGLASRHLEATRPDFRRWEYAYQHGLFRMATIGGFKQPVSSLSISADGKHIVVAGKGGVNVGNGGVNVWNVATGEAAFISPLAGDIAALSPSGKRIVTAGSRGLAMVWDAADGQLLWKLIADKSSVKCVAFSFDDKRIATGGSDGTVTVWDVESRDKLFAKTGANRRLASLAFSSDGKRIANGYADGSLMVWHVKSKLTAYSINGHWGGVHCVSFSPDGKRIISGSTDRTVKVWDSENGRPLQTFKGMAADANGVSMSADGKRIRCAAWGPHDSSKVRVWNVAAGEQVLALNAHSKWAGGAAFAHDGDRLLTEGVSDDRFETVLWDTANGKQLLKLETSAVVDKAASISPDGRTFVHGNIKGEVRIYDVASGRELLALESKAYNAAFSPDGKRIVGGRGGGLTIWDVADGGILHRTMDQIEKVNQTVVQAVLSPDRKRIAAHLRGRFQKRLDVVFWNSGLKSQLLAVHWASNSPRRQLKSQLSFSADGKRIISAATIAPGQSEVIVLDAADGRRHFALKERMAASNSALLSINPSHLLTADDGGNLSVWDLASGEKQLTLTGFPHPLTTAAFSRDGKRIVAGDEDGNVKIFDAVAGRELLTLAGHEKHVTCVAFSPDGKRIVSGSQDGTVKVWTAPEKATAE